MIQAGVSGKVLSCISFSDILILVGSTSSKAQKVLLFFLFFENVVVFRVEGAIINWVEWARFPFCGI